MTYRVKLREVHEAYTNYIRHALFSDAMRLKYPTQDQFEQIWLIDQGIKPLRCEEGNMKVGYLEFRDRNHYLMFLLRWS